MKQLASVIAVGLALSCAAAHATTEAQKAHQEKFGSCSKQAKGKKGDERRTFMKDCMKKDA